MKKLCQILLCILALSLALSSSAIAEATFDFTLEQILSEIWTIYRAAFQDWLDWQEVIEEEKGMVCWIGTAASDEVRQIKVYAPINSVACERIDFELVSSMKDDDGKALRKHCRDFAELAMCIIVASDRADPNSDTEYVSEEGAELVNQIYSDLLSSFKDSVLAATRKQPYVVTETSYGHTMQYTILFSNLDEPIEMIKTVFHYYP